MPDYIACGDGVLTSTGGAEKTFNCFVDVLSNDGNDVFLIESENVDEKTIRDNKDKVWLIGNYYLLIANRMLSFFEKYNVEYFVIEFDYKFLECRNLEIYKYHTKKDFEYNNWSKSVDEFLSRAKRVLFMSDKQKEKHLSNLKLLKKNTCLTIGSCFDDSFFETIRRFKDCEKVNNYAIYGQHTLQKGSGDAIFYCEKRGFDYVDVYGSETYEDFLFKLSQCRNLVFLPKGGDTCPRLVIEAKLLGLGLICNENVEHISEEWWKGSIEKVESYLKTIPSRFLKIIYES